MNNIIFLVLLILSSRILFAEELWEEVPLPKSGAINSYAVINSKGHIFIYDNGILKSTDNGISWFKVFNMIARGHKYSGALIDNKDNIMFWSNYYFHFSSDEGNSWEKLELLFGDAPPIVTKTMFCSNDTFFLYVDNYGLYKLGESRSNWIKISEPIVNEDFKIKCFEIIDNNFVIISKKGDILISKDYCLTWDFIPCDTLKAPISKFLTPDGIIYAYDYYNIYISYDLGLTYKKVTDTNQRCIGKIYSDNNGYTYYQDIQSSSIWISKNKGKTWEKFFEGKYCYWKAIDISVNKQYYFLNDFVNYWISTDGAKTFKARNLGNQTAYANCVLPMNNDEFFLICDNGIFYSDDKGVNYQNIEPLSLTLMGSSMHCTSFNRVSSNEIFGHFWVGDYKCIVYSSNNGMTWNNTVIKQLVRNFSYDTIDNIVYSNLNYSVHKSTDFGKTWQKINSNIPNYKNCNHPYIFYVKFYNGVLFAFSRDTLYKSYDKGNYWFAIPYDSSLHSILECISNLIPYKEKLYFFYNNDSVLISKDYGNSWSIFIENKRFVPFIISKDGTFYSIQTIKEIYQKDILCISYNEGETWTEIQTSFKENYSMINFLSVSDDGNLWTIVGGSKLYKTKYPITHVDKKETIKDNFIYLNPTTDFIEIKIDTLLNKKINDEIDYYIYNLLGQLVIYDKIQSNIQSYKINIGNISQGIYILRIGSYRQVFVKD